MLSNTNAKRKINFPLLIFLGLAFLYGFYELLQYQNIKSKGIVTLGKVTDFEGFKSGVRVYVDVYYDSAITKVSTRQVDLKKVFIGKWILLKIIPEKIDKISIISYTLPPCVDTLMIPTHGWKEQPQCQ